MMRSDCDKPLEMFRGAGDAQRKIELRLDLLAGLADLPHLRQPAIVDDRAAAGDLGAEDRRQLARDVDARLVADAAGPRR